MKRLLALFAGLMLLLPSIGFAQNAPTPAPYASLGGAPVLAVSGTSSNVPLPASTNAFGALTIYNKGTTDAYYALGGSSVVATSTGICTLFQPSCIVPAGTSITVWVNGNSYLAAITATGTTTLVIYQASGPVSFRPPSSGGGGSSPCSIFGTTAGTCAQGNDTRITGALQAANNLSDVATPATALGNLGGAPLASPALTGTPTAPTAATGDNSTLISTTAFVKAQGYITSAPVASVFGRTGVIVAATNDYNFNQLAGSLAPAQCPAGTSSALGCVEPDGTTLSNSSGVISINLARANTWTAQQTNQGTAGTSPGWYTQVSGDTVPRVRVGLDSADIGSIAFGSGAVARDLFLERSGVATARWGAPDSAAPVAQLQGVQNVVSGTTDTSGAIWKLQDSAGTGSGQSGGFEWDTHPASTTGSTPNVAVSAMALQVPAASTAALLLSETVFTGGTGSTTMPYFLLRPVGATASSTWSTSGTIFGLNMPSGFAGNALDIKLNGSATNIFTVNASGSLNLNGAISGKNTITVTQANANTAVFNSTGYSETGSDATPMVSLAGTLNTTGANFDVFKITVTNTAAGAGTNLFEILAGSGGATSEFSISTTGTINAAASIQAAGSLRAGAATDIYFNTRTNLASAADGELDILNNAATNTEKLFVPVNASLQFGAADVDTGPVAQVLRSQGLLAGGTSNQAGANWTFIASPGKGTGAGGSFIFQTTPAGSTGTVVGTPTTALTIDSTQKATFAGNVQMTGLTATGTATLANSGLTAAGIGTSEFNTGFIGWSSTSSSGGTVDTTLCRQAAGVIEIGASTGCAASGSLLASAVSLTGTFTAPNGHVEAPRVVTAAGAVTMATTDYVVVLNKTVGAATTVNLPSSPTTGQHYYIKDGKGDAATNNITITPAAGNIDGAGTLVLNTNRASAELTYDGTQWEVI